MPWQRLYPFLSTPYFQICSRDIYKTSFNPIYIPFYGNNYKYLAKQSTIPGEPWQKWTKLKSLMF